MPRWTSAHTQKFIFYWAFLLLSCITLISRFQLLLFYCLPLTTWLSPLVHFLLTGAAVSFQISLLFFSRWLQSLFLPFLSHFLSPSPASPLHFSLLLPCRYILPSGLEIPLLSLNGQLSHLLVSNAMSLSTGDRASSCSGCVLVLSKIREYVFAFLFFFLGSIDLIFFVGKG